MPVIPAETSFVVPFSMMASPGDIGIVTNTHRVGGVDGIGLLRLMSGQVSADMIRELATLLLATLLSKPDREDKHSTVLRLSTLLLPANVAVNVDAPALNGYLTTSAGITDLAVTGVTVNVAA